MRMTRVRVEAFTISLDGYGAGPDQDISNPLGVGGTDLHQWAFPTRTFQRTLFGVDGGTTGIDDNFAARSFKNVGAWILGRNMFGPIRGSWPDMNWKGWWGDTIQQYLRTGLIDELHVAISPVLLGGGERLFEGIDMRALGYECVQFVASEKATHVVLRRQGHNDA
jgi:dihydrofolate reductase